MKKLLILTLLLVSYNSAQTQTTSWKIDPVHSSIAFSVDYMVLTEVTGNFREFSGTLQQDDENFSGRKVDVTIKTTSISTENEKRDGHLRSADFFDAQKYPEITFVSKSFEKKSANEYQITGELTMHGISNPMVISAKYMGQAKDPWGNIRQGFKGTATINRTDFGIEYNSTLETGGLLIGKDVAIKLNMQFIKQQNNGTN